MSSTQIAINRSLELKQKRGYKKSLMLLVQEVIDSTEINDFSEEVYPVESQLFLNANILRNTNSKNREVEVGNIFVNLIQFCKKYDLDIRDCLELVVDSND